MPASSADVIGAALASAYQQKPADTAPSSFSKKSLIEDQLVASSKQVLLNHVEYERVGTQQSLVLTSLKNKYVNLTGCDTTGTNPNSPSGSMAHAHHKTPGAKEDQLDEPRVVLWPKDRVMLGWRKTLPPGAGMVNLGNTCYMNSSLQALFHIPSMANWLMEDVSNHTQRCEANASSASYCSICAMMRTLRSTLDRSTNVIKPSLIHHKLKSIGKTLMYGRQEDAHEFIKLLLDHMEKSYLSFRRASKLDHRSKETTPLNQIFGGYIRQQVICPLCRYVSTTFSHFQDLVLDIRSVNSVDEALNLYFKKETLDSYNAYKCERCHKKVPATKRHLIEKAPHVLLIQLKRFTFSGGKINKHINIQRTIDITRFVNGQNKHQTGDGGGPYQYRLASMVIHLGGSQHGGHYTAVAEASSGTMFEYDDSSVRSISVQSALMRNPYILFYELIRKPKDPLHIKQVVRQSSEKTLIRQNSDGIFKPIPTSHSASSVVNGYGRTSDNIGEAVSRNGIQTPLNKPPLPSHKEREKISFGLKFNQGSTKGENASKPNKIILNSGTGSLLSTKASAMPSPSSSGKTAPNLKSVSSLVPYHDDSEDSEVEDSKQSGGIVNGLNKEKLVQNGTVKSDDTQKAKDKSDKGAKALHNHKQDKVNSSDSKNSSSEIGSKSSSNSNNKLGASVPFVPRSLQIVNGASPANTSSSSSSSSSKAKGEKGWLVTDASLHSPSESSSGSVGGTSAFTVVEQPTSSKEFKQSVGHEKMDNHGWTVTIRKQRPELEKSHSHDSVLPGPSHKKDEADSASLRSKASIDSTRSDRSTKSVKKSFLSLFTCVTSARSPDSPEEEQPEASHPQESAAQESKTKATEADHKSKNPESKSDKNKSAVNSSSPNTPKSKKGVVIDKSRVAATCNGQSNLKSDSESESEMSQSKRFRDHDDEPSSPSKKCRPEDGKNTGNKKGESEATKNGPSSISKNGLNCNSKNLISSDSDKSKNRVNHELGKSKNGLEEVGKKCKKKKKHKKQTKGLSNGVECHDKSQKETSSPDLSLAGISSVSESSDSEDNRGESDQWVEKTKETIGKAKLNPEAHVVQWNGTRKMKDLSHAINGKSEAPQENGKETDKKLGMWNGNRPSEVVDELRRAGNLAFGTKVNSWDGGKSVTDEEFQKDRKELKKRSLDDLYNEEFDTGKTKKIRLNNSIKPSDNWNCKAGNVFQRVQDVRNTGGTWNNYRNANANANSYGNKNTNNYGHYNQHKNRDNYWNKKRDWNKNRDHYHQRNKPWNKFDRDHKFHKKHKEKYRHWERHD